MVVLEEGGMLTTGHGQYLQPDYLSPLPTTVSDLLYFSSLIPIFAGSIHKRGVIFVLGTWRSKG